MDKLQQVSQMSFWGHTRFAGNPKPHMDLGHEIGIVQYQPKRRGQAVEPGAVFLYPGSQLLWEPRMVTTKTFLLHHGYHDGTSDRNRDNHAQYRSMCSSWACKQLMAVGCWLMVVLVVVGCVICCCGMERIRATSARMLPTTQSLSLMDPAKSELELSER